MLALQERTRPVAHSSLLFGLSGAVRQMDRVFPPLGRVFMLFHFDLIAPLPRIGLLVVAGL